MPQPFNAATSILPDEQKAIWPKLAPTYDLEMTLYGGTAIALRLAHRESVDFDFFSAHPLKRRELIERMPFLAQGSVIQDEKDAWTILIANERGENPVKISFFGEIGFGRVGSPDRDVETGIEVASELDLLATKLKVIHQRAEWKDYFDIVTLLRNGVPLNQGLGAAKALFGGMFPTSETLRALAYFDDGDLARLDENDRKLLVEAAANPGDIVDIPCQSNDLSTAGERFLARIIDKGRSQ